uniref:Hypotheticial protein n=1 Tax=Schistosoma mansoni TaxID=6183 RepID=A0A5K4FAQ3_SCHMA
MYNSIYSILLISSLLYILCEGIILTEKNREHLIDCLQTCQYSFMTCEYKCFKADFCKNICDKTYYECQKSCYIEVYNSNETF